MTVEIREARLDEAAAIADLLNEHAHAAFGETEIAEPEVREWLTQDGLWVRVAEHDGRLAGYIDAIARGAGGALDCDIRTTDRDVADALVSVAEEHAGAGAVRGFAQGDEPVLREAFEAAGWRPIRNSFQMKIDLADGLAEPSWPDGMTVRTIAPGEEERVYEANMDSFADHWEFHRVTFEQWKSFNVGRHNTDLSLWWGAEEDGELTGICLNNWHFSGDPEFGWIGVLGVRPRWRNRGLGTALLLHSFRDFRDRGATRVGLGVDAENTTGAVRLYERAGMRVQRLNVIYEKVLP